MSPYRLHRWIGLGLTIGLCACYDAELDPSVSGVFACEVTAECGVGLQCIGNVCVSNEEIVGPVLEIDSPPSLFAYQYGSNQSVQLLLGGSNLVLTNDPDVPDPNAGYISIVMDGILQDTVTNGDLASGLTAPAIPLPTEPGLHHIQVSAHRLDGSRFETARSTINFPFWVDDGKEHIGIIDPPPGSGLHHNDDGSLRVEIASLNFTFINPGHTLPTEEGEGEGYVNLFVDAAVPDCLPTCNSQFQTAIYPAGLSRVNRMVAAQGIWLPNQVDTIKLQAVAQDVVHEPYSRIGSENDFVFDTVAIQPTMGIE